MTAAAEDMLQGFTKAFKNFLFNDSLIAVRLS